MPPSLRLGRGEPEASGQRPIRQKLRDHPANVELVGNVSDNVSHACLSAPRVDWRARSERAAAAILYFGRRSVEAPPSWDQLHQLRSDSQIQLAICTLHYLYSLNIIVGRYIEKTKV